MDNVISLPDAGGMLSERDLQEVDAAIGLVADGHARRVRLVGLADPAAVAAICLAHAQVAGVEFRMASDGPAIVLTLGPRS